jgi:hypothetical protein
MKHIRSVSQSICCITTIFLGNYIINHGTAINIQKHRVLKLTLGKNKVNKNGLYDIGYLLRNIQSKETHSNFQTLHYTIRVLNQSIRKQLQCLATRGTVVKKSDDAYSKLKLFLWFNKNKCVTTLSIGTWNGSTPIASILHVIYSSMRLIICHKRETSFAAEYMDWTVLPVVILRTPITVVYCLNVRMLYLSWLLKQFWNCKSHLLSPCT